MRPSRRRALPFSALFFFLTFSTLAFAAPSITSLSPTSGAVGASVTITGTGFGSTQGTSTVKFNGTTATVCGTCWSATSIVVAVPSGATTGNVVVTVSGTASPGKSFTVLPTPTISSLSITSGAVGASVTITGTNFGSTQGISTVKFNGTTATVCGTCWTATSIVVAVPSGATTGNVVVHASGVDTNGKSFTVVPAPSISSLSITSGAIGASVTITGTNFGSTQGTSTVKFNGTTATVCGTCWSATSIVATVPSGATTGNVVVHASGVDSNGKSFTVVAAPAITSLSITSGAVGTSVTITGTNFGSTQGVSTVKFNGTTATVCGTCWSATSIVATVPSGATTGNVVVHASGVDSNGKSFTVVQPPTISNLSPTSGLVGDSVTITGSNFGSTQGTSTVKFNGTTATVCGTCWSATSIVVPVPSGASTGNVVVTVSNVASAGVNFTVVATPAITTLSPTSGAVGTLVTINGSNFQPTQGSGTVTFNGITATANPWGATQIKALVPSGVPTGNVTVVVTNTGLSSSGKTFMVKPTPALSSLSQTIGAVGMPITITGANFGTTQGSSTVKFNGTTATTITSWAVDTIVIPVPVGATSGPVVVHTSNVDTNGINFTVATLTAINLTPQTISLPMKSAQRFTAMGTYSNGSVQNIGTSVTWSSSATTIATTADSDGLIKAVGQGQTTIQAAFGSVTASTNVTTTGPTFVEVGNPLTTRMFHTATLLPNGKVLVVGGEHCTSGNGCDATASAELYDPVTQMFTATGSLNHARMDHSATLLPNGKVLIVGGMYFTGNGSTTLASTELYDPATETFSYAATLFQQSSGHAAAVLNDGRVLIVGGQYYTSNGGGLSGSFLYDPSIGFFSGTGMPIGNQFSPAATTLNDGRVLIVGGVGDPPELYDPAAGTFSILPNLSSGAATLRTSTLLGDGKVFLAGLQNNGNCPPLCGAAGTNAAELYDPSAQMFSLVGNLSEGRGGHTATLLNDGTVLIAGAAASDFVGSELYKPATHTFVGAGGLVTGRVFHTATLLNDGRVLIVGGENRQGVGVPTAELYAPTLPPPNSLQITPSTATMQVGESRQFTVVTNLGSPRNDAVWSVSDDTLATITSDASPTLMALAPGQVTLTAEIQGVTAQAQITILQQGAIVPGTVNWSIPSVPGFVPQKIAQAVPTSDGPDLYSIQNNGSQTLIQAIKADGQQMWQKLRPIANGNSVPDGDGGLITTENNTCLPNQVDPMSIVDLDGTTGQQKWRIDAAGIQNGTSIVYCYPDDIKAWEPQIAVRGDGAVFIAAMTNNGLPPLTMVQNGQFTLIPIPPSTDTQLDGTTFDEFSPMGPPIVDTDGSTYLEYEVRFIAANPRRITSVVLYLLKISPDSSRTPMTLSSTTANTNLLPGRVIPDGQGGVLATWTVAPSNPPQWDPSNPPYPYQASRVIGGSPGTPFNLPFTPKTVSAGEYPTLVLGENSTFFASGKTTTVDGTNTDMAQVASLDLVSGAPNWSYSPTQGSTFAMIMSTSGNGLVGKTTDSSGGDTVVTLDSAGTEAPSGVTGSQLDYLSEDSVIGASATSALIAQSAPPTVGAITPGHRPNGDAQHNGTTDPGFSLVGVRDCANKATLFGVTTYDRLPIYELWDQNRHQPLHHYTVFEYVVDKTTGGITPATQCPDGSNTGVTPCSYNDGSTIPFNTFEDDISIRSSSEVSHRQSFQYGLPGQRKWGAQLYRTPPVGIGPLEHIPNSMLVLHLKPGVEALIQEQMAPYMGPWLDAQHSYTSCSTPDPIN